MLTVVLSATKVMTQWLKQDLPRIPSPDGKRIGTQPLRTDSHQLSWQCSVVQNFYRSGEYTVIATEAYSRYTLLMPYAFAPTAAEFEHDFLERIGFEIQPLMIDSGALAAHQLEKVRQQFGSQKKSVVWFRNTDLSVNGHVGDAEQWLKQMLEDNGLSCLSEDDAIGLGDRINKLRKRAKSGQSSTQLFYPVARMLDDALYRFAKGMTADHYPLTRFGDFPNPYPDREATAVSPLPNNVVSMADFRK
ncbi:MAG: hypothetical protein V7629_05880 [Motiliproteus sp.]